MKRIKVTVEAEIIVEFDENSEDFKTLFEGYKEVIHSDADYKSFANDIASMISRYGTRTDIEGVGYVKVNGEDQRVFENGKYVSKPHYVNVEVSTDLNGMVDFEIGYTEVL